MGPFESMDVPFPSFPFTVELLGGWDPSGCKWLGSAPFISYLAHLEGVPQPYLADLRSPWLLTTYTSWDDPPSGGDKLPTFVISAMADSISARERPEISQWDGGPYHMPRLHIYIYTLYINIYISHTS